MSYALRNSLILGALLCVMAGAGYYWIGVRQARRIETLQARHRELRARIESVNTVLAMYDATLAQLNTMKTRWQQRRWFIPSLDTADRTLSYLDGLLWQTDGSINCDFAHKGRRDGERYSYNTYTLVGEGSFEDLHTFIWLLEHGSQFYTVDRLQIDYHEPDSGTAKEQWNWVRFVAVIRAYFAPSSPTDDSLSVSRYERPPMLVRDLFVPLITETLPENELGLVEVDGARLKGLTHDMVFVEDGQGRTHILRRGDPVFLGWLEEIDILRNRAVFVLNKGGIWEQRELRIEPHDARN